MDRHRDIFFKYCHTIFFNVSIRWIIVPRNNRSQLVRLLRHCNNDDCLNVPNWCPITQSLLSCKPPDRWPIPMLDRYSDSRWHHLQLLGNQLWHFRSNSDWDTGCDQSDINWVSQLSSILVYIHWPKQCCYRWSYFHVRLTELGIWDSKYGFGKGSSLPTQTECQVRWRCSSLHNFWAKRLHNHPCWPLYCGHIDG